MVLLYFITAESIRECLVIHMPVSLVGVAWGLRCCGGLANEAAAEVANSFRNRDSDAKKTESANNSSTARKGRNLTEWACSWVLTVSKCRLQIVGSMGDGVYSMEFGWLRWSERRVLGVEKKESGLGGCKLGRGCG